MSEISKSIKHFDFFLKILLLLVLCPVVGCVEFLHSKEILGLDGWQNIMETMTVWMHFDLIHSCKPALLRFTRALQLHEGQYHLGREIPLLCPAIVIPSKNHWVEPLLIPCEIFSLVR